MEHAPSLCTLALAALAAIGAAPLALNPVAAQTVRAPRRPTTRASTAVRDAGAAADASRSVAHVVNLNRSVTGHARGGGSCVSQRGCAAPQTISSVVPTGVHGEALDSVWDRRFELSGHQVQVLGTLVAGGGCTEMACGAGNGCCNHCGGSISLQGGARRSLSLGVDDDPRFVCTGDDSGLCCGTEVPDGPVIVVGTLAPIAGSGGRYRIENPSIYRSR